MLVADNQGVRIIVLEHIQNVVDSCTNPEQLDVARKLLENPRGRQLPPEDWDFLNEYIIQKDLELEGKLE